MVKTVTINVQNQSNLYYIINDWIIDKARKYFSLREFDNISIHHLTIIHELYRIDYHPNNKYHSEFTLAEELLTLIILESNHE